VGVERKEVLLLWYN